VAFLTHGEDDPPALLERRSRQLGFDVRVHRADHGTPALPRPGSFDLLVVMGSAASTTDGGVTWIGPERNLVATTVEAGTPVLGVCFGGQLLAEVLGGRVSRAARPERGWHLIRSDDPAQIPPGPWMMWHEDQFSAPPGAVTLARTEACLQAFVSGPHTGIQFHPEVDAQIVRRWIDEARAVGHVGPAEAEELLSGFGDRGQGPEDQARSLFDGFVARAGMAL
jgi:GMP synthase (glutamine-hydrolysing)